ncbi:hypothetical protein HZS61_011296 [Fusarium oxysporum f. sp. conglutinans]|uniref:Uncharacterized protein n=1 Tax=Fusarium oxysporum f. sp. conglutinans TaxID=100902 RepID=A0A8H6GXK3_FUSOX|nr:hypothetical protein HZS61_011296 [Fusarium oxysporum f. sp. conglutinans]
MAGTSLWDYIFIRASIFLLHLIAPLSVAYSLVNLLARLPFQFPRVLQAWLGLEALFYLAVYLPLNKYLQRAAKHPVPPCRADRRKLFLKCHNNIPDPAQYLRKWFRNAPVSEIKRDNVKDFFRWAFLNTGDHDSTYDEELEDILAPHCLLTRCLFYFIYLTWPIILYVDGQINLMSIYSPTLVPRI